MLQLLAEELPQLGHRLANIPVVKAHVCTARNNKEFRLALHQLIGPVTMPLRAGIAAHDQNDSQTLRSLSETTVFEWSFNKMKDHPLMTQSGQRRSKLAAHGPRLDKANQIRSREM
jgi:hypothetical protein